MQPVLVKLIKGETPQFWRFTFQDLSSFRCIPSSMFLLAVLLPKPLMCLQLFLASQAWPQKTVARSGPHQAVGMKRQESKDSGKSVGGPRLSRLLISSTPQKTVASPLQAEVEPQSRVYMKYRVRPDTPSPHAVLVFCSCPACCESVLRGSVALAGTKPQTWTVMDPNQPPDMDPGLPTTID